MRRQWHGSFAAVPPPLITPPRQFSVIRREREWKKSSRCGGIVAKCLATGPSSSDIDCLEGGFVNIPEGLQQFFLTLIASDSPQLRGEFAKYFVTARDYFRDLFITGITVIVRDLGSPGPFGRRGLFHWYLSKV